jgi:hypothetical protein
MVCQKRRTSAIIAPGVRVQPKTYLSLILSATIFSTAVLGASIFLTNPESLGPVLITFWFILILIGLSGAATLALYYLKGRLKLHYIPAKQLQYSQRQGFLLGLGCTMFLALSSLKQLGWGDIGLISLLLALVEFYARARA